MSTISVIVPVYMVEKYIHRCVDSILGQSYTNFELILVDDGSPDICGTICDDYAAKDDRVVVIHQENGGLSSARNAGLRIATGEFIAFVDSDDCIHHEMYKTLLAVLEQSGADIVKSDFVSFSNTLPTKLTGSNTVTVYTPSDAFDDFMNTEFSPKKHMKSVVWDGLYRREMFFDGEKLVLQFPVGKINEDTYLFPELIFRAKKIAHIDAAFYYYFTREGGITHSGISEREINSCDLWEHVHTVLSQYTTAYIHQCAHNSASRYINVLHRIYPSALRKHYFSKVRNELFSDKFGLLSHVVDPKIRRTLRFIKVYPLYKLAKRILRSRIY